ncbi:hypothetical protein N9M17_00675 [bacterium]|jgi:hypothetical protein|nr:hypothetical protein [bacterium]MDB4741071.1 hypothetical protein [Akkermansiaceae bacterium]
MDETVPINWIHLSSDRRKIIVEGNNESSPSAPGLLLFTVEPLGNDSNNYYDTANGSAEGDFPGPLTLAVPVNDDSEISELAQKSMNSILNSLSTLVQGEIEAQIDAGYEDFGEDFNFTVENLDENLIKNHPDAIMGVLCTDGKNVRLYRVWIMLYRWTETEEGEWTWR